MGDSPPPSDKPATGVPQSWAVVEAYREPPDADVIIVLTYNVWFNEECQVEARMVGIGDVILHHRPHVVMFQEVTPLIYSLFRSSAWWRDMGFVCSVGQEEATRPYFSMLLTRLPFQNFRHEPFAETTMDRELVTVTVDAGQGVTLKMATAHLESPMSFQRPYIGPRINQAQEAFQKLGSERNCVFGGDMNWNDRRDRKVPLPPGWFDPWNVLHPIEKYLKPGYTYDGRTNGMIGGALQGRLDRFWCRLEDFDAESIEMVGTEPIPGLRCDRDFINGEGFRRVSVPVFPSDHYGLLLKIRRKCARGSGMEETRMLGL